LPRRTTMWQVSRNPLSEIDNRKGRYIYFLGFVYNLRATVWCPYTFKWITSYKRSALTSSRSFSATDNYIRPLPGLPVARTCVWPFLTSDMFIERFCCNLFAVSQNPGDSVVSITWGIHALNILWADPFRWLLYCFKPSSSSCVWACPELQIALPFLCSKPSQRHS
jgi:hypothetical protein